MTDGEWSAAVDAAQDVDPTLAAPALTDTDVSAVGGARLDSNMTVAFSASRRNGEVRGRMTEVTTDTFTADVVCVGAVLMPGGQGGLARLVGRVTQPAFLAGQTMLFDVYDSGGPSGEGDLLSASHSPTPPEEFPCEPLPPVDPIAHGNFAVRSLG